MESVRGWLIAGGIVFLLVLLFLFRIRFYVSYTPSGWAVRGRYLFIPFDVYPRPEKKPKKTSKFRKDKKAAGTGKPEQKGPPEKIRPSAPEQTGPQPEEQSQSDLPQKRADRPKPAKKKKRKKFDADGFITKMGQIAAGIRSASKPVLRFLHRTRIDRIDFSGRIAGKDPADTAIRFGSFFAAWNTLISFFASAIRITPAQPCMTADYDRIAAESEFSGSCRISVPVWAAAALILFGGLRVFRAVSDVRQKQTEQMEQARKS